MSTNFEKAQKSYRKWVKQMEADRKAGFRASLSGIDAIYGNLGTTQAGLSATLSTANERTLNALSKQMTRSVNQSNAALGRASGGMVGAFGGLYSGQVSQQLATAEATGQQVTTAAEAALLTGKGLAKAGSAAMAIQRQGVAEAQAAAQFALAQAATARAQADANLAYQRQMELDLWRLQNTADSVSAKFPGMDEVAKHASNISKAVRAEIQGMIEGTSGQDPMTSNQVNLSTVISNVATKLALGSEEELSLLRYIAQQVLAQNIWGNTGAAGRTSEIDMITTAVMQAYDGDVPATSRASVRGVVEAYLAVMYGGGAGTNNSPESSGRGTSFTVPTGAADPKTVAQSMEQAGYTPAQAKTVAGGYTQRAIARNASDYPNGDAYGQATDAEMNQLNQARYAAQAMFSGGMTSDDIFSHFQSLGFAGAALQYVMSGVREQSMGTGYGAPAAPGF